MKTIRQKYNRLVKRIWNHKTYDYRFNFEKAINNSRKIGLNKIDNFEIKQFQFTEEYKQDLINLILTQVYTIQNCKIEDLALKCCFVSKDLKDYLKENFGINSVITTGNVYVNKLQINYEPYSKLKKRLSNKNYNAPIKFHTWLTLENLDVIDLTFAPNMWLDAKMCGRNLNREDYEKIGWISINRVDKNGAVYEPKIVGSEYFKRINIPINIIAI